MYDCISHRYIVLSRHPHLPLQHGGLFWDWRRRWDRWLVGLFRWLWLRHCPDLGHQRIYRYEMWQPFDKYIEISYVFDMLLKYWDHSSVARPVGTCFSKWWDGHWRTRVSDKCNSEPLGKNYRIMKIPNETFKITLRILLQLHQQNPDSCDRTKTTGTQVAIYGHIISKEITEHWVRFMIFSMSVLP